jgi:endonuclease YncB( thermonuclease family)
MGFLASKAGIMLALVVVGLIALAVVARNWSCREHRERPDRERRREQPVTYGPYLVDAVETGNKIICVSGRGRREKKIEIYLADIGVPAEGTLAEESKANLAKAAGDKVTVTCPRAARRPERLIGEVIGQSSEPLQVIQLRAGLAICDELAPPAYQAAQEEAKQEFRGIWIEPKPKLSIPVTEEL